MKALLVAEKPSLMKDIRSVYQNMNHPDDISFTSLVGHVVELNSPETYREEWGKPWKETVLPMIPDRFKYHPKQNAKAVYDRVKQEIKSGQYDYIINACDAGREGELIFHAFYEHIGGKLPVKRLWASDSTDETLKEALLNLLEGGDSALVHLGQSARFRSYFDWLMGMNLSRAATLKSRRVLPVGRVMTPTLAIVVERELEIRDFKPKDYFEVEADFGSYKGLWFNPETNENRFMDRAKAEVLATALGHAGVVDKLKKERKRQSAPTLYSLLELQKDAGRIFGYTAQRVLGIAQSLYEDKKVLSYPRTESRHIPKNLASKVPRHLQALTDLPGLGDVAKQILGDQKRISYTLSSNRYVDDKKVTDHHALLPTTVRPNLASLTQDEKNVYLLVVRRLLAIFMDPFVTDKTTLITKVDGESFKSTGNVVVDLGYMSLYQDLKRKSKDEEEKVLPNLQEGQSVQVNGIQILAKKTTPPQRYDDPSLLQAMANAGRFVDDEELKSVLKESAGLGTSATRDSIIEKLIKRELIERQGKKLAATDQGIEMIQILDGKDIVSPSLTAVWEVKLREVEDGNLEAGQFYKEMVAYTEMVTNDFLGTLVVSAYAGQSGGETGGETVGKCPKCGGEVFDKNKNLYECRSTCGFVLWKETLGTKLTKTDVKNLLAGKPTRKKKMKFSSGKTTESAIILGSNHKVTFHNEGDQKGAAAPAGVNKGQKAGSCPKCKKDVVWKGKVAACTSCKFFVSSSLLGTVIPVDAVESLIKGEMVGPFEFTWKSGKKGNAKLSLGKEKIQFVFD